MTIFLLHLTNYIIRAFARFSRIPMGVLAMDERSNKQFFEELCERYYEKVFFYCLHLARSRGLSSDFAKECTHDTFLEAGKQINKLREHPNVQGWLYVVARNLICGSIRKILRKEKHETITDYSEFDIADE